MPDRPPIWITTLALVSLCLGARSARTEDAPRSTSAVRSASMRELSQAITLVLAPAGTRSELIPRPIPRYSLFDRPAVGVAD
jgi:hypothetical protein